MLTKAPKKLNILICEDVRQESGNKISLLGTYVDGIIFTSTNDDPNPKMISAQLAIFGTFGPLDENCQMKVRILSPDGEVLFETPDHQELKKSDSTTVIALKMIGLEFKQQGKHKLEFNFDKFKVTHGFSVSLAE
ncbi:hypothetical protein C9422_18580 [Pseudomonas sp. B1(2018)]|uniref:DUF6941 family protein n=1 Tax=Pseudomonas sp. B1(2018) TaxID=2233856 RepID=UPI000D5CDB8A|nr:hypothetical protein [Pseudomonas sp. B1(2018)]PVZ56530.1 hypothetical protein C9422_18580 [Pseudomonas sp. B1(2018)]